METITTQQESARLAVVGDASVFGEAEQLLLSEARTAFEYEQQSAGALHARAAFFLAFTSTFAAIVGALLSQLFKNHASLYESFAEGVLAIALGLLAIAAVQLVRHALSRSYQAIATPRHWLSHLNKLKTRFGPAADREVTHRLQYDLLDAFTEAAEVCSAANEVKVAVLTRVSRLLRTAIVLTVIAVVLLRLGKVS